MSTLKEGIICIDDKGILRGINKSACEILGLRREQALNRRLTTILPESDLYTVLATGRTDHDIEFYLNKHWIIANRSPIVVEGKVVGRYPVSVSVLKLMNSLSSWLKPVSTQRCCALRLMSTETN